MYNRVACVGGWLEEWGIYSVVNPETGRLTAPAACRVRLFEAIFWFVACVSSACYIDIEHVMEKGTRPHSVEC